MRSIFFRLESFDVNLGGDVILVVVIKSTVQHPPELRTYQINRHGSTFAPN